MPDDRESIARVGMDSGGTFTDLVWLHRGRLGVAKVPSRPDAPAEAVLDGLRRVPGLADLVCHGTTVGTNAVLARQGGPASMVVTRGFRDVLAIGRGERDELYSPSPSRPAPLLSPDRIFEIDIRLDSEGNQLLTPDPASIQAVAQLMVLSGAQAIAVGILHSTAYPSAEIDLADQLSKLTGLPAFPSSRLAAYPREYERWSLASLAAYLSPVLGDYLSELEKECPSRLALMGSSGGLLSPALALENPARCVLSGPAGGAIAAMSLGCDRVLALDMGGTSTDVTLLAGKPPRTREAVVSGVPVPLPTIDIHTIGAGGGSIVRIDQGGMLALGPQSAGADPGPACYGRGGPATFTDAVLLAGRLVPERFLAGEMPIHRDAASKALQAACPKGMSVDDLIDGILDLAIVHLNSALRKISVARGIDPALSGARFTLVPFGGAGALLAIECARALGLSDVLHPRASGAFSAIGLLSAPLALEAERAIMLEVDRCCDSVGRSEAELIAQLSGALAEWSSTETPTFSATLECRYVGQTHALEIPLDSKSTPLDPERIRSDFESEYRSRYTYVHEKTPVEIVTVRVRGEIGAAPFDFPDIDTVDRSARPDTIGPMNMRIDRAWKDAPVYDRDVIPIDEPVRGPALVIEDFATLYLPPDTVAHLDRKGHMHVELE